MNIMRGVSPLTGRILHLLLEASDFQDERLLGTILSGLKNPEGCQITIIAGDTESIFTVGNYKEVEG